ncbi:MAG: hypothetical protein FWG01_04750 [Betaproteobacteria bacterium]|nr:hypothetical protein [Betaproteobacteria bacterium]
MQSKKFSPNGQSAFMARFEAQKMVFGPVVFQCVRYAWKRGMLEILAADEAVHLYLLDLPQQLELAKSTLAAANLEKRAHFYPINLLDDQALFPGGMDVIWMSQLLSCFGEAAIVSIFKRAAEALALGGYLLIMDTFWDRQQYDIASYCLINTSPYFTAIASGNSKIYESEDYIRFCQHAGLVLISARDNIGFCHSLLRFTRETVDT